MDDSAYSDQLIMSLLYYIQYRSNPLDYVGYVMGVAVRKHGLGATPARYADAVRRAIESDERLNAILETGHSEELLRQFLKEVLRQIEEEGG